MLNLSILFRQDCVKIVVRIVQDAVLRGLQGVASIDAQLSLAFCEHSDKLFIAYR